MDPLDDEIRKAVEEANYKLHTISEVENQVETIHQYNIRALQTL